MAAEIKIHLQSYILRCHKSAKRHLIEPNTKKSALSMCTGTVLNSTLNADYYRNK